MNYDDAVAVLRSWVGRHVTHQAMSNYHGALEAVTGVLHEGNPHVDESKGAAFTRAESYRPNERFALFKILRDAPVPDATFPLGATFMIARHTTSRVEWDRGREGHALRVSVEDSWTSLWSLEDA